jgi:hypothetical protein
MPQVCLMFVRGAGLSPCTTLQMGKGRCKSGLGKLMEDRW